MLLHPLANSTPTGQLYTPLKKPRIVNTQSKKHHLQDKNHLLSERVANGLVPNMKSIRKGETDVVPEEDWVLCGGVLVTVNEIVGAGASGERDVEMRVLFVTERRAWTGGLSSSSTGVCDILNVCWFQREIGVQSARVSEGSEG